MYMFYISIYFIYIIIYIIWLLARCRIAHKGRLLKLLIVGPLTSIGLGHDYLQFPLEVPKDILLIIPRTLVRDSDSLWRII